jgi:gamma-glutamyl:cysteine ligase YbdK (ATP-grasp superfamily)
MPAFDPLSMGYDWEVWVSKETGERLDMAEIVRVADEAHSELPTVEIGVDDEAIENRSGPQTTFRDLLEVTERSMKVIRRAAARDKYLVWGTGTHPLYRGICGLHVHVGSIYDFRDGLRLRARFLPYVPVIGAILANSPIHAERISQAKSERLLTSALGLTRPPAIPVADLWQFDWGGDTNVRLPRKPTIEIRAGDSTFSERLAAEATTLAAATMYALDTDGGAEEPTPSVAEYVDYIVNRWNAAMYGLQATFAWNGKLRPVSDVVEEVIEFAKPGLKQLEATKTDLAMIRKMAKKRQTQADLSRWLWDLNPDPYRYSMHLANIVGTYDIVDEYLKTAPTLEPVPRVEPEQILKRSLCRESGMGPLWYFNRFPIGYMVEALAKLERDGVITARREMEKATIYTANDAAKAAMER